MKLETGEECRTTTTSHSLVAACLDAIEAEQRAAMQGLYGYSVTARHDFITSKLDRMGAHIEQLIQLVGEEETEALVIHRLNEMEE